MAERKKLRTVSYVHTGEGNLAKDGKKRYEAAYGPLRQSAVTAAGYTWINDPGPWEMDGGKK